MNKLFKPYLGVIITGGVLLFLNALFREFSVVSMDIMSLVILVIACASEVMSLSYERALSVSLSGPITIFAIFYKPLLFVYLMIILYVTLSKVHMKYYIGDRDTVFDMKWCFNISQYIILAKLTALFLNFVTVEPTIKFIVLLTGLVVGYNVLNIAMTTMVISLYSNTNGFRNLSIRELGSYVYYYHVIISLLVFGYLGYGLFSTIIVAVFLLPIQGSILQSTAAYALNQKLIMDKMTKAFNRNFLEETLVDKLDHLKEFTLLFMDLDDFKFINDQYGHIVGDEVLKDFVCQLKGHLRREDRIFRYGGDEFCILFPDREHAQGLMERIKDKELSFRCEHLDEEIRYSFSMGVLDYDGVHKVSFNDLIDEADKRMYLDKEVRHMARALSM